MPRSILLVVLSFVLVSCSGGGSGTNVTMTDDRRFDPNELTVSVGDTVTWTNESAESHTVTTTEEELPEGARYFASGGADSEAQARDELQEGLLTEGETFEVTFDRPGTYAYVCIPHEDAGMTGSIVVEE
jgi:plastocyanin